MQIIGERTELANSKKTLIKLNNGLERVIEIFPESYMYSRHIVIAKQKYGFLILGIYGKTECWWLFQDEQCTYPMCSTSNLEHILSILKIIKETEKGN
ncbi:MAG: hypothetical protein LBT79_00755 [Elusimicrobiota bacterium]|jgi:hypothetical protein|nr:hypothetical protein [Elusimicrobiota bacterium]